MFVLLNCLTELIHSTITPSPSIRLDPVCTPAGAAAAAPQGPATLAERQCTYHADGDSVEYDLVDEDEEEDDDDADEGDSDADEEAEDEAEDYDEEEEYEEEEEDA